MQQPPQQIHIEEVLVAEVTLPQIEDEDPISITEKEDNSNESKSLIHHISSAEEHEVKENVVNIDEIPIQSKKKTFEELLQEELAKNDGQIDPPKDSRTSLVHSKKIELELIQKSESKKPADIAKNESDNSLEEVKEAENVRKNKTHKFLKRNTGKVATKGKVKGKNKSSSKKYSYYKDNFNSKEAMTTHLKLEKKQEKKQEKKEKPEQLESKKTPKPIRKFLVKGKGKGGGKGVIPDQNEYQKESTAMRSRAIKVSDKALPNAKEIKSKPPTPEQSEQDMEEKIDQRIALCNDYIDADSGENLTDDESDSDVDIEVFQKLPLSIRGAINKEIEKKRSNQRELRKERDEFRRWQNRLTYVSEDLEEIVKDRYFKLQTDQVKFEQYKNVELERIENRINESKTEFEVNTVKREIERIEKAIKEQEKRARDNTQPRNKSRLYYEPL